MKTKLFLLVAICMIAINAYSQNWLVGAGGVTNDEALDVVYDNATNDYFVTGYFTTTATFGSTILTASGNSDIFIARFNVLGNPVWAIKAGGTGADRGYSIQTDNAGNILITGYYYGTANFGGTTISSVSGSQDVFIAKYDINANLVWVRSVGGNDAETGYGICADNLGSVIVTGQFRGVANFGSATLSSTITPATGLYSFDIFTVKYDASGNFLWVEQGRAKYDDRGMDVAVDAGNNIFIVGQFSDTIVFDVQHNNMVMNSGYLMKYDPAGNEQWFVRMSALQTMVYGVAVDQSDNIFITGDYKGNMGIFTIPAVYNTSAFSNKVFIAKFTNTGTVLWVDNDGSDSEVTSKSIAIDPSGDVYIAGLFRCRFDEYSQTYGSGVFYSAGYRDVFITKYTSSGTRQWFKQFGSNKDDYCSGIAVKFTDKPVIAGGFENVFNVPASPTFPVLSTNFNYTTYGYASAGTYCGYNNYQDFVGQQTHGQKDIFVTSPVDTASAPFDYFKRTGSGCLMDFLDPCIGQCLSPITHCGTYIAGINTLEIDTNFIGAQYNTIWSTGSTQTTIQINSSGTYWLHSVREDGCFQDWDTVSVIIYQLPPPPMISDDNYFNTQQLPSTYPIKLCYPDTSIIWGTASNPADTIWWTGAPHTIINDTTISTNVSGGYILHEMNAGGCTNTNSVIVEIDDFANHDTLDPHIVLCNLNANVIDTVSICINSPICVYAMDSAIYASNLSNLPYSDMFWSISPSGGFTTDSTHTFHTTSVTGISISGYYTIDCILKNYCADTIIYHFSRTFYVDVHPNPVPNIILPSSICPADTVWLYSTNFATNYTWSGPDIIFNNGDSIQVLAPSLVDNQYNLFVDIIDTVSGTNCSGSTTTTLYARPYPIITMLPLDGIVCPFDPVLLTCEPGLNYYWISPSGDSIGTTQSIYVDVPGYYHCIHTAFDGCVMTSNFVEVKEYNTPFLNIDPGNIICIGGSATITAIASNDALIQWQPPLSGSSITQVVSAAGTYSCHITQCGIMTIDSVIVTMSTTPSYIIASDSTLCPGDTLILNGNPGMQSYEWLGLSNYDPYLIVNAPGTYTLQTTDAAGCIAMSAPFTVTAMPQPAPPMITDTTICAGQSITLIASASGTVGWFGNVASTTPFFIGDTLITAVILANTTYYVQTLDSVCGSNSVPVNIFITTSSGMPQWSGDTTLCAGDSLSLTALATGVNYLWTLPGGATDTAQSLILNTATLANSGTYTLYYNTAFCTSLTATINVTINPLPVAQLAPSSDTLCFGDTLVLQADSVFEGYLWFPGNETTPTISVTTSGIYYAQITSNGCSAFSDTATITVLSAVPSPVSTSVIVCAGNAATLSATGTGMLVWYDSTYTPVDTGTTFTTPVLFASAIYYVQSIDVNGCSSGLIADTAIVPIASVAPIVYIKFSGCSDGYISFYTPNVAGATYSWTGPNGFTSTSQYNTITNAQVINSGVYQVIITISGCSSLPGSAVATINQTPPIPLITGVTTYCEGDSLYLAVVNPLSTVSYHWSSPTGSVTSDSSFVSAYPVQVIDGGLYTLTIIENGCLNDTTIFIMVIPKPTAIANCNSPVCAGDTLQLNGNFVIGGSYWWNGPNGFNSFAQFCNIFSVTAAYSGIYNYVVVRNGCYSDTASVNVTVNNYPVIDLGNDTAMCIGHTIVFTLPSWYNYLWFNGATSNIYTATDSGLVYVYAYAGGCVTIDSVLVDDFHCCEHSPNFITPNGDGENDFLYFDVEGARALHCTVFDRWGKVVYEWEDIHGNWDGKRVNGTNVENGTYYYVVDITFIDNREQTYKGFVQVVK